MVTDTSAPRALASLAPEVVPTMVTALIRTPVAASEGFWALTARSIVVAADMGSVILRASASAI